MFKGNWFRHNKLAIRRRNASFMTPAGAIGSTESEPETRLGARLLKILFINGNPFTFWPLIKGRWQLKYIRIRLISHWQKSKACVAGHF